MILPFKSERMNMRVKRGRKLVLIVAAVIFLAASPTDNGVLAAAMKHSYGDGDGGEKAAFTSSVSVTKMTYSSSILEDGDLSTVRHSRLIIFKEGSFPAHPEELLRKWPEIEATSLPEAGMLRLTGNSLPQLQQAEAELRQIYSDSIEQVGEDPKIIVSDKNDELPNAAYPSANSLLKIRDWNSTAETTLQPKNFLRKVQTGSEDDSSPLIANATLYQKWGWDIKEVTNDGRSLSVQAGNHNIVVAVVDSGIDASHPDLSANIMNSGKSFVPGVADTSDWIGHGTMVAGAIAANGKLLGVGPNLGLVAYKVFEQGEADSSWVIEAIIQAVRDDVDVINLSLGTYKSLIKPEDQAVLIAYTRALTYAYLKGVVVVASSGTNGLDISNPFRLAGSLGWENDLAVHAPGGLPGVITVSASNREHERAFYSNYGLPNMIAAPAGDYGSTWFTKGELNLLSMCLTTYPTQLPQSYLSQLAGLPAGYEFMIGTSLAAPKVSAAAALLIAEGREKGVRINPDIVKKVLLRNATDYGVPGPDGDFGVGVVNIYEALKNIRL
ncbi:S8 family serine peptidase [Paenibacillus zanthoxyli]|uniref:S8 family serine peptidase n=1 Tax=Paenibacillus zanthoxyli TaxID=369399 RepID=UPI0004704EFF|nr:S8 family serine peptidase [Paenibacillus zanthoxyli]